MSFGEPCKTSVFLGSILWGLATVSMKFTFDVFGWSTQTFISDDQIIYRWDILVQQQASYKDMQELKSAAEKENIQKISTLLTKCIEFFCLESTSRDIRKVRVQVAKHLTLTLPLNPNQTLTLNPNPKP